MANSYLASLPTELLHNILSYSVGNNGEDNLAHYRGTNHPYYTLAATSRHLRDVVESFCQHLLLLHKDIVKFNPTASENKVAVVYRTVWVKWVARHCAFCGRNSGRKALMNRAISCCRQCDRKEWAEKLTMTAVMEKYNLSKLDLFTPNVLYPDNLSPALFFATYDCAGVETTMFMKSDVEARAKLIHGDDPIPEQKLRRNRRKRIEKWMPMRFIFGRWTLLEGQDLIKTKKFQILVEEERQRISARER
ncbi:hypothetical protein K432DRAFT_388218 [Lepidopterella palustris CBS 459.81]|uniref:Uncharacterized protein n=1 Tax=Lepidopterella palustris CBS 459.81 TaxID=1314670 RepID=A0A8E2ELA6_9PEZI|nr:hypothetical protein K432DRAFT_388218 [Lepidopterella palustris CBS 459.81]